MSTTNSRLFQAGLMKKVRSRFANIESDPFTGRRIYLENAGGTLKLKSIFPVIETFTAIADNAGRRNAASHAVDKSMAQGRKDVALMLGAKSGKIIAEQSTTGMIFRLLGAIAASKRKGNLVTTVLDHASIYSATQIVANRFGMEHRYADLDSQTGLVPAANVLAKVDKNTAAVTVIHASNILGTRNDVTEITRAIRRKNPDTYVLLDGAQHASHGRIDVASYGADAWFFVPYKTYSKAGISFAWLSDRLANLPHDNLLGKPKDAWDLGTRETAAYACMSPVVEYFRWLGSQFINSKSPRSQIVAGMKAIESHEAGLLKCLLNGTDRAKGLLNMEHVRVLAARHLKQQEAIIAFEVAGHDTDALVDYYESNGIRLHNRVCDAYSAHTLSAMGVRECIRVSFCHYNTPAEVEAFLKLTAKLSRPS